MLGEGWGGQQEIGFGGAVGKMAVRTIKWGC